MNATVSLAPKQRTANERITASRESGCDAYLRCMWEQSIESGESVNWHSIDDVYSSSDRHAIGWDESRPSIQ